ncbi:hypothetical protein L228DRAFT_240432 [Xylona heveae TC161]|uniref:Uncharacterized protein n=1 Tax=Xylona heveae (strain CBS 132557 / TC161) TaxID=1328760 RepID=A0A165F524_XYLHT|nr:hypothetical protein L228DRAFT_240432 [Xylona heveae TC161]KZF20661.1 hypothetical protein L228DRAFT_240432 [Xylona heveae TC161]
MADAFKQFFMQSESYLLGLFNKFMKNKMETDKNTAVNKLAKTKESSMVVKPFEETFQIYIEEVKAVEDLQTVKPQKAADKPLSTVEKPPLSTVNKPSTTLSIVDKPPITLSLSMADEPPTTPTMVVSATDNDKLEKEIYNAWQKNPDKKPGIKTNDTVKAKEYRHLSMLPSYFYFALTTKSVLPTLPPVAIVPSVQPKTNSSIIKVPYSIFISQPGNKNIAFLRAKIVSSSYTYTTMDTGGKITKEEEVTFFSNTTTREVHLKLIERAMEAYKLWNKQGLLGSRMLSSS